MINLAPWFYRNLLGENELITSPVFFEVNLIDGTHNFEAAVTLKESLRPSWLEHSKIYRNGDGSGTDQYKNVAVYKAISETLERLAFYEMVDTHEKEFSFDTNPTTTGMAAFPYFNSSSARKNAKAEAIERWAIHEFNKSRVPISSIQSNIPHLKHYEIHTPFKEVTVSLLVYKINDFYVYGFAGGSSLNHSFTRALVELDRNIRVMSKSYEKKNQDFTATVDKTIYYFSTDAGNQKFNSLIESSPKKIINTNPKILCDKELIGPWTKYTKVWRYLLEDSYFNCSSDSTFFMF